MQEIVQTFPRMGGGDPLSAEKCAYDGRLFPAWAGVILNNKRYEKWRYTFPRMGGGDPAVCQLHLA